MNGFALIPARGGSKGIKEKNIVDLCGKPLIAHTIEPALHLREKGLVQEVIVSTDSPKIAELARELGATVPCLRPADISGDEAKTPQAVAHMVGHLRADGVDYESVLLLQTTSPLRAQVDVEGALELYEANEADSLISCYLDETISSHIMYERQGDWAVPLNPDHNKSVRRQDHKGSYIRNGAIYITRLSYLDAHGRTISDRPLMYTMPKKRSLNLDTEEDLTLLRKLLSGS